MWGKKYNNNNKKHYTIFFLVYLVDPNILNFSQKIQTQKIIAFWDTLSPPMRNFGFQPTDI